MRMGYVPLGSVPRWTDARPPAGTLSMRGWGGILAVTLWALPSPDMTVSTTGTAAGADTVGGLRLPPGLTVKTAGSRTLLVPPEVWIGPPGWWVGVCAGGRALAEPVEAPEP